MERFKLLENRLDRLADFLDHPIFKALAALADELNVETYTVGGFVRDLLLDRPCKDIDVVTVGSGIELAQALAKRLGVKKVTVYKNFGTAMFVYEDMEIEFVGARKESYRRDSRKPIVEDGTLQDDQNRRDFTINALAICLNEKRFGDLVDPFGGVEDLRNGIIKTPLEPGITYSDDPLRMMRAIRFAAQLNFNIEEASFKAIRENKKRLSIVSQERITTELNKIILSPVPSVGFRLLEETGLLGQFFPEMIALKGVESREGKKHKDNFYHTLQVLDNICENTNDLWLRWSAILHDIAKPPTKRFDSKVGWTFHGHEDLGSRMVPKIFKRLKLPLDHQMRYVQKLVRLHLRPIALVSNEASDSAARRLLFDAGEDIDDLMVLCHADITSKNAQKVARFQANYERVAAWLKEVEEKDQLKNWQPPISGEDIMKAFNIGPCREIGTIKNLIKDSILDGEIPNEHQAAYDLMLAKGKELGLNPV